MKIRSSFCGSGAGRILTGVIAAALLATTAVHASVVVSVQSVTAAPGSSGNTFDVFLTNTGPSGLTVGAFSFGVTVSNSDISFTDANTSTGSQYIFAGNSLFGPDLTGPVSGQSLGASDIFAIPFSGATVGTGATVGLGHILFDVVPGAAPGSFPVTLSAFPTTSLADENANDIPIDTLAPGQITITGVSTVPEPSTFGLLLVIPVAALVRRARRESL